VGARLSAGSTARPAARGIPRITLHGLHHTYTTQAPRGLPPKVVAGVLGYAGVQFTLPACQQRCWDDKKRAAVGLSKLLS